MTEAWRVRFIDQASAGASSSGSSATPTLGWPGRAGEATRGEVAVLEEIKGCMARIGSELDRLRELIGDVEQSEPEAPVAATVLLAENI